MHVFDADDDSKYCKRNDQEQLSLVNVSAVAVWCCDVTEGFKQRTTD